LQERPHNCINPHRREPEDLQARCRRGKLLRRLLLCSWRQAGQHPPAPEESWYTASATKGAPPAASTADFQVSRLTAASTGVLRDPAEQLWLPLISSEPGKGDFRSFSHVAPVSKGRGNYAVIGLIAVLEKAGEKLIQSSPDKEGLQGNTARAKQRCCGEDTPRNNLLLLSDEITALRDKCNGDVLATVCSKNTIMSPKCTKLRRKRMVSRGIPQSARQGVQH